MNALLTLERLSWGADFLLRALLLGRLFSLGLASRYRSFALCLALQLTRTLILLPINRRTTAYGVVYGATLPLLLAAYVFVVLEIYAMVLESYRGLAILGRRTMLATLGVSVAIGLFYVWPQLDFSQEIYAALRAILLLEGYVCAVLLFFLIAMALFLLWYPIPIRKNLLLYSFGFTISFAATVASLYVRNAIAPAWTTAVSTIRMITETGCFLTWIILLKKSWEVESRGGRLSFAPEQQMRLLGHLKAMNDALESPWKS